MFISGGNDAISCKMFAGTLAEVALRWFKGLPARSVTSFEDLASRFVQQFSANKNKEVGLGDLFDVRQGANEPLKSYLDRFNKTTVLVEEPDEKFFVTAFIKGLRSGTFSEALVVWKPRTMDEVRVRAEKHKEAEESSAGKKRKEAGRLASIIEWPEPQYARRPARDRRERGSKDKSRSARPFADEGFTPLNARPSDILDKSLRDETIRRPTPFVGTMGRNTDSYCRYHRTDGHTTDYCWTLKQQIEQLIQKGALKKYTKEGDSSDGKRRKGGSQKKSDAPRDQGRSIEVNDHETADKGGINSIAGGFSGGGATQSTRGTSSRS